MESNELLAQNIIARLDISRNGDSDGHVSNIHHPHSTPGSVCVHYVFIDLEEGERIDIDAGNISVIRGHPGCDGTLMAVEPA